MLVSQKPKKQRLRERDSKGNAVNALCHDTHSYFSNSLVLSTLVQLQPSAYNSVHLDYYSTFDPKSTGTSTFSCHPCTLELPHLNLSLTRNSFTASFAFDCADADPG